MHFAPVTSHLTTPLLVVLNTFIFISLEVVELFL
jgi:hypothetical protein